MTDHDARRRVFREALARAKRRLRDLEEEEHRLREAFSMSRVFVFAYGSNLYEEQMRERCPRSSFHSVAAIPGFSLAFAGYSPSWRGSVATIRYAPRGIVPGAIYRVSVDDLIALDRFEGVPWFYERITVRARTVVGFMNVYTYRLVRDAHALDYPPAEYLARIREGYDRLGLPKTTLTRALRRSSAS